MRESNNLIYVIYSYLNLIKFFIILLSKKIFFIIIIILNIKNIIFNSPKKIYDMHFMLLIFGTYYNDNIK